MDVQVNHRSTGTGKELVRCALQKAQVGDLISVKEVIAYVRKAAPDLPETDCQLTELIVVAATSMGFCVVFDLHE
ncbi:hypothetical protein FJ970_17795 [Mesorhizobium sp. B2-1-8]|uniref:hypothetical protein n=1 Tax=Mesorhizobium sp. B2-1-8 TaxID=2589967 RepID=UPI00112BE8B2|nr:hypothetical protein [Mesorhizobium sp. B2-1-8]UCI16988.1 hypothetical protein FJ970_17795 [Mesorhizobium sp. B2-1-8]